MLLNLSGEETKRREAIEIVDMQRRLLLLKDEEIRQLSRRGSRLPPPHTKYPPAVHTRSTIDPPCRYIFLCFTRHAIPSCCKLANLQTCGAGASKRTSFRSVASLPFDRFTDSLTSAPKRISPRTVCCASACLCHVCMSLYVVTPIARCQGLVCATGLALPPPGI